MKRMLKRILAFTLSMVMVLGCVTTASAAEDTTPDVEQPTSPLTIVSDVKAYGEIVNQVKVAFTDPVENIDDAEVYVTIESTPEGSEEPVEEEIKREIVNSTLDEDGMNATFDLEEGGFATDPWNSTNFVSYRVKIGELEIVGNKGEVTESCPDVDKFDEVTYTTPEYTFRGETKNTMDARYFVPDKTTYEKPEAGYPLVIWQHGGGEQGTDNRIQIAANNVPNWTEEGTQDIFGGAYILAPQNHAGASVEATKSLIDQFIAEMGDIDPDRIYIGGCSYGGSATWAMIRTYPEFFAAAYPICRGPLPVLTKDEINSLVDLPIYITVAAGDNADRVYGLIEAYNQLKAAGNTKVHITLFNHSEFEGIDGFAEANGVGVLDHWSWVYVHDNYDAAGDDYDGKNFIDSSVDAEYEYSVGLTGAEGKVDSKLTVKDGVVTYAYTVDGTETSITLNGKNEQPVDAGYGSTIHEWIAAQNKATTERSAGTLTVIRDVKDYGEIVSGLKVELDEPLQASNKEEHDAIVEGTKVSVTVNGEKTDREIAGMTFSDDNKTVEISLVEGGFGTTPWNTVNYQGYEVQIDGRSVYKIANDVSDDVDKFEAVSYTVPEYTWNKGNKQMTTMDARAYTPDKETYEKPEAGYPLVVWLHGGGETGDDNRIQIAANNVPKWTEQGSQDIFQGAYVLAPQNHAGAGEGAEAATKSLIDQFIEEKGDIDRNRIYVGGCSYGGSATWKMIRTYPNYFAAAYPICSGPSGGLNADELVALKNMPIYITFSTGDSSGIVSGMIKAYNDLSAAGNKNVHITMFEHSECEGQAEWIEQNNRYIDHWSWVYVHNNYDAKGDDFDGKYFIDTTVDGTYNDGAVVVENGVLTYTYTANDEEQSISLNGKNERPEDAGYPTIQEWIADQKRGDTLTTISDVKAFGEIVNAVRVDLVDPIANLEEAAKDAKVTVTVNETNEDEETVAKDYERTVTNVVVNEDGSVVLELEEGGFATDPWNTVNYVGYKVEIGGRVIDKVAGNRCPDVDKFKAVTYTVPEYQYQNAPKTTMDARYFVPDKTAYEKPEAGYPLVIWLHGGGETGTDNRIQLAANNVPAWTEKESQDIFGGAYVLSPQNHASAGEGAPAATKSLIDQFIEEMGDIDTNRIYVGGCSYGGMGTWQMLRNYPDFFAAAYPICGSIDLTDEEIDALADMPIYMTVSSGDTINRFVSGMIGIYNRLRAVKNPNLHIAMFEHSEFEGEDGFVAARGGLGSLDHWSWVYVHENYDAKGDDYDGKNFIDMSEDGTYNVEGIAPGASGANTVVENGVLTYNYPSGEEGEMASISLDGKTERPEDTGYETIKEWLAAQNLQNRSAGTLTVVRDVKDFGEIVTELRVVADEPIADDLDNVKVFVTVNGERMEREVEDVLLAENGGNEAVIKLVEGGFATDPWNSVNYQAYEVKIGDRTISKVADDISPDVDKFEAVTYTVPEYQYQNAPKTTMDARYFVPDKTAYEKPEAGYPLVIWLHGGGETGTDNRIQLAANNVPAWTEKESQDIFGGAYVLSPQNHASAGEGAPAATKSLIDQFIEEMGDIDTNRIYIGGCSYGGMGTWQMLRNYPDFFAAAYPICGAVSGEGAMGALTDEEIKSLANLPIYMTVSSGDTIFRFPYGMIETYNRLKAAGNKNLHIAMFEHSEFEGQDGFVELRGVGALDHWSWVYVHNNYDAKGDDYDGKNFLDMSKDGTYNDGRTVIKDGVLTYSYTSGDDTYTVTLDGKTERPEETGYETIKEWIAAQNKGNEPPKKDFTDVPADAWYANAVEYVVAQGIMVGTNDGTTFEPDTTTTRAMVAQMLYQMEGKPAASDPTFSDVPAGEWFSNAIAWAAANKVVNGYENNKFGPYDTVTREQLAMMLYKYASFKGLDVTGAADLTAFPDAGSVSDWAENAVKWAVSEKLINGKTNGSVTTLDPQGLASRAEVAQIFMKFCAGPTGH